MVKIQAVTFEHHRGNLDIGETAPRISWSITGDAENWIQLAYELEISHRSHDIVQAETYRVESTASVLVPWPSKTLKSSDAASVRVGAYGRDESITQWSDWHDLEIGLLACGTWSAQIVAAPRALTPSKSLRPVLFRKEFVLKKPIHSTRL